MDNAAQQASFIGLGPVGTSSFSASYSSALEAFLSCADTAPKQKVCSKQYSEAQPNADSESAVCPALAATLPRKALTRLGVDNTAAVEYGKLLFEDWQASVLSGRGVIVVQLNERANF